MLSNPLSQIERTKDAYAGNMQGLQKRANMTKELIDLLAMQQLKQDLDAIKRDQMMQQQGNPATIKDQMQQGLMGEYRQQAAKEMGVGPSEMGTVARAQQGMPQGMPQQQARMPQGMPQGAPQQQMPQQPQMAQGVMSQARPVQLAGGGIVAFQEGGPTKDELANFLRAAAEKRRASEPSLSSIEQTPRQREMQELIARLAERRENPFIDLSGTKTEIQERRRSRALQEEMEEMFTPKTGGIQVGQMPRPEPIVGGGIASQLPPALNPSYVPPALSPRTPPGGGVLRPEDPTPSKPQPNAGLALLQEMKNTVDGIETYEADEGLRRAAREDLGADPEAAGLAAIERIRTLSKMDENEKMLEDMRKRVQATYDETAPSRMDNLIDLFTAGGRGGITGVGVRGGQLRREEADRRRQLDQDVMGIQATTVELNRNFGADAANAYQQSEANTMRQKENARTFLETADKNERQSIMQKAQLSLQAQNNVRQLYSDAERNRLLGEQITSQNARGIIDTILGKQLQAQELKNELEADLRLRPKYAELDQLEASDDPDDAIEADRLRRELDTELLADTADLQKDIDSMRRRLAEAQAILEAQSARLGTDISFGSEIDTAIREEG